MKLYRWFFILLPWLVINGCATSGGFSSSNTPAALQELTELKEEIKELRNSVEEMQFNTKNEKRGQYSLFQDLDRRLLNIERAQRLISLQSPQGNRNASNSNSRRDSSKNSSASDTVSVKEQQTYDAAFKLLKQSKYEEAIKQFELLADSWPNGLLADDAYYWQSEAYYVSRDTEAALSGFKTVIDRYPNSDRVPEAFLKIGYIYHDIGDYKEAAKIFRDILNRFPSHSVATSAQTRLRRIEQTIQ